MLFEKPKQLQIRVLVLDGQSIREGILVRQNRYSDFKVLRNTGKSGVQNRPKTSPGQHPNHEKHRYTSKSSLQHTSKKGSKNDPKIDNCFTDRYLACGQLRIACPMIRGPHGQVQDRLNGLLQVGQTAFRGRISRILQNRGPKKEGKNPPKTNSKSRAE